MGDYSRSRIPNIYSEPGAWAINTSHRLIAWSTTAYL